MSKEANRRAAFRGMCTGNILLTEELAARARGGASWVELSERVANLRRALELMQHLVDQVALEQKQEVESN